MKSMLKMSFVDRIKNTLQTAFFLSIVYAVLFYLYLGYYRYLDTIVFYGESTAMFNVIVEVICATTIVFLLFLLASVFRPLLYVTIAVFYAIGGAGLYFLINFNKMFDVGVYRDFLSVEKEMTFEYVTFKLILVVLISIFIGLFVTRIRIQKFKIVGYTLGIFWLVTLASLATDLRFIPQFNKTEIFKAVTANYSPILVPHHIISHGRQLKYVDKTKNRQDITEKYSFSIPKSNKPLNVVLIIGESTRGNILQINGFKDYQNTPMLSQLKDLVSFTNATSSGNSTRESIPYMLNCANKGELDRSQTESGVISVFKSLGFKTAWLGTQGLFGRYDYSYGALANEADKVISRYELSRKINKEIHDEHLLPFLDSFIANNKSQNKFIVLHMLGSHWHFKNRHPSEFGVFQPFCKNSTPGECSKEEILNGYHNTVLYTDFVIRQFIKRFEGSNAIVLFASDHGVSLREQERNFGHGYESNIPSEQYDIGMMVWMSDEFKSDHQQYYKNLIKKRDANVSHDNIFHTLLGCAGVRSNLLQGKLNLCN